MKKILSIIISAVMACTVMSLSSVAFAESVQSPNTTAPIQTIIGQVNGTGSNNVTYVKDQTNPNQIVFTYTGDGELTGWSFPGMTEGTNYQILSEDGNTITILLINYTGSVIANALVDEAEEPTEEKTTKKPSGGSTSPATGAAGLAGIAIAGAGISILAALKKKDAE